MAFSSRAGIVTFAKKPVVNLRLMDFKSKKDFNDIVDKLTLIGSTTRIDSAMIAVRDQLRNFKKEDFASQPKIVFLLTDGSQTDDFDVVDPSAVAEEIRRMGAKIFVIGVGSGVRETELLKIAGDAKRVHLKSNFQEFNSQTFLKEITETACKTGKSCSFYFVIDVVCALPLHPFELEKVYSRFPSKSIVANNRLLNMRVQFATLREAN